MRFVVILAILVAQGNCDCSPKECSKRFRGACNPFDGRCYVLCKEGDESCRSMNRTLCTRSVLDKIPGHPEYADHFACGVALPRHWCDCNTVDLRLAEQDVQQRFLSKGKELFDKTVDKIGDKASELKDKLGELGIDPKSLSGGVLEKGARFVWKKALGGCGKMITIGIMFMPKDIKTIFMKGGYTKSSMEAYLKTCLKPEYQDLDGGPDKSKIMTALLGSAAKAPIKDTNEIIKLDADCRDASAFERYIQSVNGTTVGSCEISFTQEQMDELSEEVDTTDVFKLVTTLFEVAISCNPYYTIVNMVLPKDFRAVVETTGFSVSSFKAFAEVCVEDKYWKDDEKTKPDKSRIMTQWMISLLDTSASIFKTDEPICIDSKAFKMYMEAKNDDTCKPEEVGEDSSEEEEEEEEEKSNSNGNGGAAQPQATTAGVTRIDGAQIAVAMILLGVELL